MNYNTSGFHVLHYLLEFGQTQVHCVNDAIQRSHPLLPLSPPVLNLCQHQNLFPVSQLFASGGQSIEASESVLPMEEYSGLIPRGSLSGVGDEEQRS